MNDGPSLAPDSFEAFETTLRSYVTDGKLPAVAFGIAKGGETLRLGAFGLADREEGVEATAQTPYSLASVTKPMTTTAVALLASRGLIDLDAPINPYLGEAAIQSRAGDADEVTIRNVADHTAGLPLHFQFYYEDEPYTRPPFKETARRYAKTFTPVGARHHYSNLGYGLLDYLIERISGQSYAQFMAEEVFGPLRMQHSSIGAPPEGAAVCYGPDGVGYPHYDFDHPGGSAAYSSVEDLLGFGRFHLNHSPALLDPAGIRDMHWASAKIDGKRGYGFGWGVNEDRLGMRLVQHTGFMGGVSTILRLVPELDLVIAVVANGQSDLAWKSADDALAILHEAFRTRLIEERVVTTPAAEPKPVSGEYFGLWKGELETHAERLPLELDIVSGTTAWATLNGQCAAVDELQIRDGRLLGVFDGDVQTTDAARRPYRIHLDLGLYEGRLEGAAVTISKTVEGGGGAPGKRFGNALASWVSLKS